MITEATTLRSGTEGKARSAVLVSLALGAVLAALVAMMAATAREAEASFPGTNGKIVFISKRTTGTGVDNPTGDSEIFTINPDGTGLKQLTTNTGDDREPTLSPDGQKIAYTSQGDPTSNPGGDYEVYLMNAADGSGQTNLSNSGATDGTPVFSPDGQKIAYESHHIQTSNPEGDSEVYLMRASDGSGQINLSNNAGGVADYGAAFSPDGQKVAYSSEGIQTSNSQGDSEVYRVNALDGTGQKNLSNNGADVDDYFPTYSPDGTKVAYTSSGIQTSNSQGDSEIYRMNTLDGLGKKNLSNNGSGVFDHSPVFSPDGTKVAYSSSGKQTSNPEGDYEIYRMNTLDGLGKKNLPNDAVYDYNPDWGRQAM